MLSLLLQGWVVVLAGAEALPKPGVELPLEPGVELPLLESGAELPLLEHGVEMPLLEPGVELPLLESGAELSSLEPGLGWVLLQTVLVLAGVILLAYILLSWGGKYLLKLQSSGGQRAISIVERVSVDARKSLLLVKVANDYFLLSSGERVLTVLSKLNAEDVEQALSNNKPAGESGLFLKKLLERKKAKKPLSEGEL
jgi:flagellar biogenesis protein FliO